MNELRKQIEFYIKKLEKEKHTCRELQNQIEFLKNKGEEKRKHSLVSSFSRPDRKRGLGRESEREWQLLPHAFLSVFETTPEARKRSLTRSLLIG